MPYIKPLAREALKMGNPPVTAGDLNYLITRACVEWLDGEISYDRLNAVIGALECAKLEMYRRMVVPYEDQKCRENGDVY